MKTRETCMHVNLIGDAVYVDARCRIRDKYYNRIEAMPGAEFVTGRNGHEVSVMPSKLYSPEEIAAQAVIIRAKQIHVDPVNVTLQGNIAEETELEILRILHREASLENGRAATRLRQAQEDTRYWTERSNWLWKKLDIRQQEA